MNKIQSFVDYFDWLVQNCKEPVAIPDEILEMRNALLEQATAEQNKPLFTELGLELLDYLQKAEGKNFKASVIGQDMNISSRKISGAIRKLVTDGYVIKYGQNPVIYNLTEKGKTFNIKEYKEKMNNEQEDIY